MAALQSAIWLVALMIVAITIQLMIVDSFSPSKLTDSVKPGRRPRRRNKSDKPNIVVLMTDDQDLLLGSTKHMPKMQRILGENGVEFENTFVSTPMCCPSRSTFLTGMYPHNHNTYTNNDNCSSIQWQQTHERFNFATYLSNIGYRTAFFGKYLNEYNGTYIPPGWRVWAGLIRNSRFYNYTINFNGNKYKHADNYYQDYLTDLIANDSVTFLKQSKQLFPNRPTLMVLSVPAPHGPEDSAPQYQHMFENNTDHRTPSWNYAPNPDKQWLLGITGKMEPIHQYFTDMLQRKRLQTLQSVDDLLEKVHRELKNLGELDNTYIMYTSDHGYHLGQYGLIKGKAMPYDFDVRVPMYIRGPGVPAGIKLKDMVSNVDIAPTILEMAGMDVPDRMDGLSLMKLIKAARDPSKLAVNRDVMLSKGWRDTVLLERGKITHKKVQEIVRAKKRQIYDRVTMNNLSTSFQLASILSPRERKLVHLCSMEQFRSPCKPGQESECRQEPDGRLKLYKCSSPLARKVGVQGDDSSCICAGPFQERSVSDQNAGMSSNGQFVDGSYSNVYTDTADNGSAVYLDKAAHDVMDPDPTGQREDDDSSVQRRCRILGNMTISCEEAIYRDRNAWKNQKYHIDMLIKLYKQKLEVFKGIRKHLKKKRPNKEVYSYGDVGRRRHYITQDRIGIWVNGRCHCEMTAGSRYRSSSVSGEHGNIMLQDQPISNQDIADSLGNINYQPDQIESSHIEQIYSRKGQRRRLRRARLIKRLRKRGKRKRKKDYMTRNCNVPFMKCFTHDNEHWRTPPYWDQPPGAVNQRWGIGGISSGKSKRKDSQCKKYGYECQVMDNSHWKTTPKWQLGPFCFCSNSNNNTYWCLRTINATHNFLYCEFITTFVSYFDMRRDPHQLHNAVHSLNYGVLQQLHDTLDRLRSCRGARECTVLNNKVAGSARAHGQNKRERRVHSTGLARLISKRHRRWRHRKAWRKG